MVTTAAEVAQDHWRDREYLTRSVSLVAQQMWAEVDPRRIIDSWAEQVPELTAVVTGAQRAAAGSADDYLAAVLDAQDLDAVSGYEVAPEAFAGHAADGGMLLSLLTNPAFVAVSTYWDLRDLGSALRLGGGSLDTIVRTEVADAGRLADQVSMAGHDSATGYVRQTDGNPCARCLLLAGRVYRWNRGFQRHPRCGCVHVPTLIADPRWDRMSPRRLYDQMTDRQRARAGFTIADREAIADGADIGQIINARHRPGATLTLAGERPSGLRRAATTEEGASRGRAALFRIDPTTRQFVPRAAQGPRWTVDEIYRIAGDDRALAVELLGEFGYLRPVGAEPTLRELRAAAKAAGLRRYSRQSRRELVARLEALDRLPRSRAALLRRLPRGGAPGGAPSTTVAQLREVAKARGIRGYSTMRKQELLDALGGPAPAKAAKKAAAKAAPRKATTPDLTGARRLSTVPEVRAVQIENRIREAYNSAPKAPGGFVDVASLREAANVPRADFDAAIRRLGRDDDWRAVPVDNRRMLTDRHRAAAVRIGEDDVNVLAFAPGGRSGPIAPLRPLPATPAKAAKAAKAAAPPSVARSLPPADRRAALRRAEAAGELPEVEPFYGNASPFSQHHQASFTIDGVTYPTTEHFMMAEKARMFGDDEALARILATPDPLEAKRIGRQVRNFDAERWDSAAYGIVVRANLAKFSQNPELRARLLATGDRVLVEAAPRDVVWGIGRGSADPAKLLPSQWRGRNQLGFALMDVREQLARGVPFRPAKAAVKKAAPVKKAAAPKPPPAPKPPSSMTPTALRKEIGDAGEGLPLSDLPKADLAASVDRLRAGATVGAERAALEAAIAAQRQIVADQLTGVAEALASGSPAKVKTALRRAIDQAGDGAAAKILRPVQTALAGADDAAKWRALAAAQRKARLPITPKPLPSPEKMTPAALRKELEAAGVELPAKVGKPDLQRWVGEVRGATAAQRDAVLARVRAEAAEASLTVAQRRTLSRIRDAGGGGLRFGRAERNVMYALERRGVISIEVVRDDFVWQAIARLKGGGV